MRQAPHAMSNILSTNISNQLKPFIAACLLALLSACVYEIDVQQGNKLEPQDIESIQVGMTRNQVKFLLGTPVVTDVFHEDRWDYIYYFRAGRSNKPERRWIIVWFDENIVREVQRDVETRPT
jgi:outer membrane protein assembly factor BamE